MALQLPTIRGNHERQLLAADRESMSLSDRYAADSITPRQREWLSELPATLRLNEQVFLCHATPANDVDCYLEDIVAGDLVPTNLAAIQARTGDCDAELIFCGHSHIPRVAHIPRSARAVGSQVIVNPGSVGIQAYAGHHPIPHVLEMGAPHARYAIAERGPAGWSVELIAVPYDWDSAARLAEQRGRRDWVLALRTGFVRAALAQPAHGASQ